MARNFRADVWKATGMFESTVEALLVTITVIAAVASGILFGLYWGGPGRHSAQRGYDGVFRYLQVVAERLRQQLISESEAARLCREQFWSTQSWRAARIFPVIGASHVRH